MKAELRGESGIMGTRNLASLTPMVNIDSWRMDRSGKTHMVKSFTGGAPLAKVFWIEVSFLMFLKGAGRPILDLYRFLYFIIYEIKIDSPFGAFYISVQSWSV